LPAKCSEAERSRAERNEAGKEGTGVFDPSFLDPQIQFIMDKQKPVFPKDFFKQFKDREEFCADLKEVYAAPTREAAEQAFLGFEEKWGAKYRHAIASWKNNWANLTSYFDYPLEIRKIIYTTNTIENLNRGIRKYTKTKVQFTDDQAVLKAVYLAIMNIEKKWSMPIQNWGYILQQFLNIFETRCRL